jgi:uncharacterized membrane protein YqjE
MSGGASVSGSHRAAEETMDASGRGSHPAADQSVGAPDPGPGPDQGASVADLFSRLGDDVTTLFRQELELAKVEIKQEGVRAARAGAMFGAAAVLGLVTVSLLAWTVAWGLAELMPTWLAFLITTVLFAAIAAGLAMAGKKRMAEVDLTPRQTIETLQQDKQMLSDRMNS